MDKTTSGWINGFIGVLIFSGSLPATRVAVMDFDPVFLTVARAAIAGAAGACAAARLPARSGRRAAISSRSSIVALGVVVGFPLLTALALQHITSAHSIVFIGLLPLATAIFGVLRGGERPRPAFWLFSCLGSALVAGFALAQGVDGLAGRRPADARGHHRLRPRLCRRREAVAQARRLAGDLLGAGAVAAGHAGAGALLRAAVLRRHRRARLDRPRLCLAVQHADRLRVLVSRPGAGRHRRRRPTATAAALLRPRAGGARCCTSRSAR